MPAALRAQVETILMLADVFLGNSIKRNRAYADRELIEEFSDELPRALRANPIVEVPADVLPEIARAVRAKKKE